MSLYLEEAAALLRQAAKDNEKDNGGSSIPAHAANPGRERIAKQFAQLAAIDRGLIPPEMVGDLLSSVIQSQHG
jgi:hypothetical protein